MAYRAFTLFSAPESRSGLNTLAKHGVLPHIIAKHLTDTFATAWLEKNKDYDDSGYAEPYYLTGLHDMLYDTIMFLL